MRYFAFPAFVLLVTNLVLRLIHGPDPVPQLPRLMLWAWESPQDLRFVPPGKAGIAFLAQTIWLNGGGVRSRPRLQPLLFNPGTDLVAVVRFESEGKGLPPQAEVITEIAPVLKIAGIRALQIDFDARESEHQWYAELLRELRRTIPSSLPLTITALESWCEADGWINDLAVADATPMLFRMGPGENRSPTHFAPRICGSSIGVSTDELSARVPKAQRIYVFHPGPWTKQAYDAAVVEAGRWFR